MHLAALVESANQVCCRYRLRAFSESWQMAGHSLVLVPWPRRWRDRPRLGQQLQQFDAVILQRRLLPRWELALLRKSVHRLIFDFDDAVFLRDSYSPKGVYSARRWRRFAACVRAADAVMAGNDWLAERARSAGATAVATVPTCVDVESYPVAVHDSPRRPVRLVWVGSSSTLQGIDRIRDVLESIGRAIVGIRLRLICDRFLDFNHVLVERCVWSQETEAADIADADIGISWLPDDDWSRGKCGLKVLQYMAAGLPVVANPIGVHAEMIRPGETGILAKTLEDWVSAVRTLCDDPSMRRTMGEAGRRRVEQDYSVTRGAALWRQALARLDPIVRQAG